ncbi:hypothetical protein Hanom_Chr16g01444541 [Helianthus anomalus]
MISHRSIKDELAKGQSQPETVTTRAKVGSKWKKPSEPQEDNFKVERQFQEFVNERLVRLKAHKDKCLAEAEENLAGLRSIAAAKDMKITQLEKEVNSLEKQIMVAEI